MTCCSHCIGAESLFNRRLAQRELRSYRKSGARRTTRLLLDAILSFGVRDKTLLDIGSGIGAIPHELLASGAGSAVVVDASAAYLEASQAEAVRRGHRERLSYCHDDFVEVAGRLPPADIVTLDRVICCYPDVERLVDASVSKATQVYGLVYPRERRLNRLGFAAANAFFRLRGSAFRLYVHPGSVVEAIIYHHGFRRRSYRQTFFWQAVTYVRT
jgi:magnesium-protoporphyrin O-methyltransferase